MQRRYITPVIPLDSYRLALSRFRLNRAAFRRWEQWRNRR